LKRDNNNFLKDMLAASLTSQSLIMLLSRITSSVFVRRRLLRQLKGYTLWKLVIHNLDNKSLRELLIFQCHPMFKVTSQY
jgi:hypothetical protein